MSSTDQKKAAVRQSAFELRKSLSSADQEKASQGLMKNFLDSVPLPPKGSVISAYAAFNNEINVWPLIKHLLAAGYVMALPFVLEREGRLTFRAWRPDTPLRHDLYGIEECDPDHSEEVVPDFLIVPMLGFDAKGNRIGYGAGVFDRTFAHLSKIRDYRAVGVAHEMQRFDDVPVDHYDRPMDMIITDKNVYRIRADWS